MSKLQATPLVTGLLPQSVGEKSALYGALMDEVLDIASFTVTPSERLLGLEPRNKPIDILNQKSSRIDLGQQKKRFFSSMLYSFRSILKPEFFSIEGPKEAEGAIQHLMDMMNNHFRFLGNRYLLLSRSMNKQNRRKFREGKDSIFNELQHDVH